MIDKPNVLIRVYNGTGRILYSCRYMVISISSVVKDQWEVAPTWSKSDVRLFAMHELGTENM